MNAILADTPSPIARRNNKRSHEEPLEGAKRFKLDLDKMNASTLE